MKMGGSSLAHLLADCDANNIRLALADGGGVEIDAPKDALTDKLLARLKAYKADLLAMLRPAPDDPDLAVDDFAGEPSEETEHVAQRRGPYNPRGGDWPADVAAAADFALLLTPDDLPATPFDFGGPHGIVVDADKFLWWLQADVRRGPAGPRAMSGVIQDDLRRLRRMLTTNTGQHGQHSI